MYNYIIIERISTLELQLNELQWLNQELIEIQLKHERRFLKLSIPILESWILDPERSKNSEIQIFKSPKDQRLSTIQRSTDPKVQRCKGPKVQRFKGPKVQRFRDTKIQRYKDPKVQRNKGSKIQRNTGTKVPRYNWMKHCENYY